jgi:hypothetical protein
MCISIPAIARRLSEIKNSTLSGSGYLFSVVLPAPVNKSMLRKNMDPLPYSIIPYLE